MSQLKCKNRILGFFMILFLFIPALSFSQVAWVKDFDSALKQAAKEKKFIVLDVSASW
jgi:hypothetical protein